MLRVCPQGTPWPSSGPGVGHTCPQGGSEGQGRPPGQAARETGRNPLWWGLLPGGQVLRAASGSVQMQGPRASCPVVSESGRPPGGGGDVGRPRCPESLSLWSAVPGATSPGVLGGCKTVNHSAVPATNPPPEFQSREPRAWGWLIAAAHGDAPGPPPPPPGPAPGLSPGPLQRAGLTGPCEWREWHFDQPILPARFDETVLKLEAPEGPQGQDSTWWDI